MDQIKTLETHADPQIPGVKPAGQVRSRALQDKFITAGQKLLQVRDLEGVSIQELCDEVGCSVGGFYSRFENKEVFFDLLCACAVAELGAIYWSELSEENFGDSSIEDVSARFIEIMVGIYIGPWRGVMREAFTRIKNTEGAWLPMRVQGEKLREHMTSILSPKMGDGSDVAPRIGFAMQMVYSVLNNELINPNLRFTVRDPEFRDYLAESFSRFLLSGPK